MKPALPPKVLFIGDKWCAGRSEWGVSEWEANLYFSLRETGLAKVETFHFDDYFRIHQKHGDEALLQKIKEWKPDLIFIVIYKMPGTDEKVPMWATFQAIKELQIPIAAMWEDCVHQNQVEISKALLPYTTLNVVGDSGSAVRRIKATVSAPGKYSHIWVPKNPKIWNDPKKRRNISISYVGTPRNYRMEMINALRDAGIPVQCGGGEANEHLTTEQYADRFQRSKITLSFARGNRSHVLNARPFEAMSCGAMVLEQESCEAPVRFIPYVDYVPFKDNKDLIKKAKYYLEHDREREKIARSGCKKMKTIYSAKRFWEFVIGRSLDPNYPDIENADAKLLPTNLSHTPKWQAIKLRLLYAFFSGKFFTAWRSGVEFMIRVRKGLARRRQKLFPAHRQTLDKK